jgi:hypothetical protein
MIIPSARKRANPARECAEPSIMSVDRSVIADSVRSTSSDLPHAHRTADQGEMVAKRSGATICP